MLTPRARIAVAAVAAVAVLLLVSQLVLPGVAERRLRDRLQRNGTVERVDVRAFPALQLLWGRADRVVVRMREGRAGAGRFADLLADTRDAERVDAVVRGARILTLRVRELRLRKRGRTLEGSATVTDADLRAALPPGFDARPIASRAGVLVFEGSAALLGRRLRGQVVVAARDGNVVLAPNVVFGGFLTLTVFRDPRIEALAVGARPRRDGFVLTARARLRE